jgi:2,4-dienoyl-CoA reductase-like NADH-dependent reductase (Old Yellow Enzyme family)
MLEVTDAVTEVWGPGRVGMHLAPRSDSHGISDANPAETFGYIARELGKRKIAFLMAREYECPGWLGPRLKDQFGGVYIANERFTLATAEEVVARGDADAVAFGKLWIANPDLVERFRRRSELNEPQAATFYSHGAEGYSDYPAQG